MAWSGSPWSLWEAHWTGPECEESEGHQRSIIWVERLMHSTYKCCMGHLFMKMAWPVSKVPLIHKHTHIKNYIWSASTLYTDQYWSIHACYICTYVHTCALSLTRGPHPVVCPWATCHPQVWFTALTPWLNPVGCSEPSCTETGTMSKEVQVGMFGSSCSARGPR